MHQVQTNRMPSEEKALVAKNHKDYKEKAISQ